MERFLKLQTQTRSIVSYVHITSSLNHKRNGDVGRAWCGKAMVKKTPDQKYHKDCARKAERSCVPAGYQFKLAEKQRPTPPRYSIKQINDKAKPLGMNYGHYSTLLSQGKVEPPDER